VREFAIGPASATMLTATGAAAMLPSGASPPAHSLYTLTVAGSLQDYGTQAVSVPYSGVVSASQDGRYLSIAGYSTAAGTYFGASTVTTYVPPPMSIARAISVIDSAGNVFSTASVPQLSACDIKAAVWYPGNATLGNPPGFYVSGGLSTTSPSLCGGLYWVPMPNGISGPAGAPVLIAAHTSGGSSTNWKALTCMTVWQDTLYACKMYGSGTGGGIVFPSVGSKQQPTSTQSLQLLFPMSGSQTGTDPRAIVFVPSPPSADYVPGSPFTLYVADANAGLSVVACTSTQICTQSVTYVTCLPGTISGAVCTGNKMVSAALVTGSDGAMYVAVVTPTGLWLWPATNTGAYANANGNCCAGADGANPAKACCWAGGAAVATPAPNVEFRGVAAAPVVPGSAPTPSASPSITPSVTGTSSMTPLPSASLSATPTISTTPSFTPSITATNTPSSTVSLSRTPSITATPSATQTPSQTPTLSITPSSTSVPNVLVNFAVAIKPTGTVLTPAYMASAKSALALISTSFAQLLSVSPSLVRVINITDLATGDTVVVASGRLLRAAPAPARRELAAPGSLGVSINCAVDLGKTPTQDVLRNFSAVLSTPAAVNKAAAGVGTALASFASLPASSFAASVPATSVVVSNSQFAVDGTVVVSGATGASSSVVGGGAGGGVAAALLLALSIWTVRSYQKHKRLGNDRRRVRARRQGQVLSTTQALLLLF